MCILQDLQCEGIRILLEACRSARAQVPSRWKPLRAPAKASVQIHKRLCLSQCRKPELSCTVASCVGNWCQGAETLRFLLDSFQAPVICKLGYLLISCPSLWESLGPPNSELRNNFPSSYKVAKRRYKHEEFLYWMQCRPCKRHRQWFVQLNRLNFFF